MKKKILLAVAMIAIISLVCFAAFAEDNTLDLNETISVDTDVSAVLGEEEAIYCVTVDFGNMDFTYVPVWDPDSCSYSDGIWSSESNDILIVNKSNVAVDILITFKAEDDFSDIEIDFLKGKFSNNKWEASNVSHGTSVSVTLPKYDSTETNCSLCSFPSLSGYTNNLTTVDTTVGTITVTASEVEAK